MLSPFTIERPTGLSEALGLVGEDSVPYWGGTELLLAMKMGLLRPRSLIDLKGLADLTGVWRDGDQLVVGAGVTHDDLARSPLVRELAPMLADIEGRVGNARVRAQGSIGGNLCFAEPRSDVATVLQALDGSVRLASARGGRVLPIGEFVQGAYWTARAEDEIVVDIRVPLPAPRGVYLKFQITERPAVAVAAVDRGAAASASWWAPSAKSSTPSTRRRPRTWTPRDRGGDRAGHRHHRLGPLQAARHQRVRPPGA